MTVPTERIHLQRKLDFAHVMDWINTQNLPFFHTSKSVQKSRMKRMFASCTSSYTLPWIEVEDEFVDDISIKVADDSSSLCSVPLPSPASISQGQAAYKIEDDNTFPALELSVAVGSHREEQGLS